MSPTQPDQPRTTHQANPQRHGEDARTSSPLASQVSTGAWGVAPLTPPGTVEANDAMRADLEAERERVKAAMVRNGFGRRETVLHSRKRSKRDAQDELFNAKPQGRLL